MKKIANTKTPSTKAAAKPETKKVAATFSIYGKKINLLPKEMREAVVAGPYDTEEKALANIEKIAKKLGVKPGFLIVTENAAGKFDNVDLKGSKAETKKEAPKADKKPAAKKAAPKTTTVEVFCVVNADNEMVDEETYNSEEEAEEAIPATAKALKLKAKDLSIGTTEIEIEEEEEEVEEKAPAKKPAAKKAAKKEEVEVEPHYHVAFNAESDGAFARYNDEAKASKRYDALLSELGKRKDLSVDEEADAPELEDAGDGEWIAYSVIARDDKEAGELYMHSCTKARCKCVD